MKTVSLCPKCIKEIPARIVEENNQIVMHKTCSKHGNFTVKISDNPAFYYDATSAYQAFIGKCKPNGLSIMLTSKCNLNCPICFASTHNYSSYNNLNLQDIKKVLKNFKGDDISLSGGEPTMRDDLDKVLRVVKKSGNSGVIVTNGIKLCNLNYLNSLKSAGLSSVRLSFDGFDDKVYEKNRGKGLLKIKIQALNNLKKLNVPTILEMTISRGINEDQIAPSIEYAVKNKFICGLTIRSYCNLGDNGLSKIHAMSIYELIDKVNIFPKKDLLNFQKFYYIISDLLGISNCSYLWFYVLLRGKNGHFTINDVLGLNKISKQINQAVKLKKKGSRLFKTYVFSVLIPSLLISTKTSFLLKAVPLALGKMLFKIPIALEKLPNNLISIMIEGSCDPLYYDKNMLNCTGVDLYKNGKTIPLLEHNIIREKNLRLINEK